MNLTLIRLHHRNECRIALLQQLMAELLVEADQYKTDGAHGAIERIERRLQDATDDLKALLSFESPETALELSHALIERLQFSEKPRLVRFPQNTNAG